MAYRVVRTPGERQAVGVHPCGDHLALAVADPERTHPFDLDPALLDDARAGELHEVVRAWLDSRGHRYSGADVSQLPGPAREVVRTAISEVWANTEHGEATRAADVAMDVIGSLVRAYLSDNPVLGPMFGPGT